MRFSVKGQTQQPKQKQSYLVEVNSMIFTGDKNAFQDFGIFFLSPYIKCLLDQVPCEKKEMNNLAKKIFFRQGFLLQSQSICSI